MSNHKIMLGSILFIIGFLLIISFLPYSLQLIISLLFILCIIFIIFSNNNVMEKILIFTFFFLLPFEKDILIFNEHDYHSVTQPYFQINILQIPILYFLIRIIRLKKNLKLLDRDLVIIYCFNILCFISVFWAINPMASFYDSLRYAYFTIIYVYFSRCVDLSKNKNIIFYSLGIGLLLQLLFGLIQIYINGPIGLSFLGESSKVFRDYTTGFEKGFSGTFGHPGPIGTYALFIYTWTLYLKDINKILRQVIIIISGLIIILSAGRTSIILLMLISIVYLLQKRKIKRKNIIYFSLMSSILFIVFGLFSNKIFSSILKLINRFINSDLSHQFNSRVYHWEIALNYIKEKPILGWGINNYLDITYNQFPMSFNNDFFLNNPIHNLYLLYAVEIGIVGLFIFLMIVLKNFVYYIKAKKNLILKDYLMIMKGFILSILVFCIYNLQGWGGVKSRIFIMFVLASAFIYNLYKNKVALRD